VAEAFRPSRMKWGNHSVHLALVESHFSPGRQGGFHLCSGGVMCLPGIFKELD